MPTITTPGYPDIRPIQLAAGYTATRATRTIVHASIDPDNTAPYLTMSKAGPRTGALALLFATAGDAQACFDRHALPLRFGFTHEQQPTMSMVYIVTGDLSIELDPVTRRLWVVTIPYTEA